MSEATGRWTWALELWGYWIRSESERIFIGTDQRAKATAESFVAILNPLEAENTALKAERDRWETMGKNFVSAVHEALGCPVGGNPIEWIKGNQWVLGELKTERDALKADAERQVMLVEEWSNSTIELEVLRQAAEARASRFEVALVAIRARLCDTSSTGITTYAAVEDISRAALETEKDK